MVKGLDRRLYMTTAGEGLLILDSTLTTYQQYKHDPVNPFTIISNSLRFIVTDSTGNLLITSLDGANYTDVFGGEIEYINYLRDQHGGFLDNRVIGVAEDINGHLWLCMREMVYIYDRQSQQTKTVRIGPEFKLTSQRLAPQYVERARNGEMWVALRYEGIAIFSAAGECRKIIRHRDHPQYWSSLDQTRVIAIR